MQFIGKKAAYALSQNVKLIACIGELLEEREAGKTFDGTTVLELSTRPRSTSSTRHLTRQRRPRLLASAGVFL